MHQGSDAFVRAMQRSGSPFKAKQVAQASGTYARMVHEARGRCPYCGGDPQNCPCLVQLAGAHAGCEPEVLAGLRECSRARADWAADARVDQAAGLVGEVGYELPAVPPSTDAAAEQARQQLYGNLAQVDPAVAQPSFLQALKVRPDDVYQELAPYRQGRTDRDREDQTTKPKPNVDNTTIALGAVFIGIALLALAAAR